MNYYIQDLYAKLGAIAALERDWDSYDSDPIPPQIIEDVRQFLQTHWSDLPLPNIIPCADGIDVEWHYPKWDMDVCFRQNNEPFFFIEELGTDNVHIEAALATHFFILNAFLEMARLDNFKG